jgi:serpin B
MWPTFLLTCILLCSTAILAADIHQRCQFGVDAAKQSSKAVSEFALKLYQKIIAAKPEENTVFSPVSIALGLALLESGTSGDTKNEIQRYLGPAGSNQADSSALYESLQRQLQIRGEKAKLSIANGFFYADTLSLKPDFVTKVKQCFETQIDKAPFKTNTEEARRQINQWVSNATAQKIPELFKPRKIDATTVAVLANAIHMKAAWADRFERSENLPFYKFGRANQAQTVSFMVQEKRYAHASNDKAEVVEIPYDGAPLSMYILLPKQRDGMQAIETGLNGQQLKSLFTGATQKMVTLKVPKFSIRSEVALKTVLQQLGVNKIFSDQADFSRMADGKLKVSDAVHEAFIKINENGTEASAATGFQILPGAPAPPPGPPISFVADHPFMFSIVHKPTGALVFAGKVNFIQE